MLVEQVDVQGADALEVVLAVVVPGRLLAVEEVVVQRDDLGHVHPELVSQPLGEGGLARRRRPGDEHDPAPHRLVGQLGDLLSWSASLMRMISGA